MPRYIFPAATYPGLTGGRQRYAQCYRTATSKSPILDLCQVADDLEGDPIPNGRLTVTPAGAIASFVGPEDITTLYYAVEGDPARYSVTTTTQVLYGPPVSGGSGSTVTMTGGGELTVDGTTFNLATASALASGLSAKANTGDVLAKASNLSDLTSASAARTNLGLGTAATQASSAFTPTATTTALDNRVQVLEAVPANAQTGTSYTLVLSDAGKVVERNNASANTITIPPNSSVAFPVGAMVLIRQVGAGPTTIAAGSGVTIRSRGSALALAGQWAEATVMKRATDEWVASGDLV